MELRSKVIYHSSFGTLNPGDTTEGLAYTEEKKNQMVTDFPDWFEVITKPEEESNRKQKAK